MGYRVKNPILRIHTSIGEPPGFSAVEEWSVVLHCGIESVDSESPNLPLTDLRDCLDAAVSGAVQHASWWSSNAGTWWSGLTSLATPTDDSGPWQDAVRALMLKVDSAT